MYSEVAKCDAFISENLTHGFPLHDSTLDARIGVDFTFLAKVVLNIVLVSPTPLYFISYSTKQIGLISSS